MKPKIKGKVLLGSFIISCILGYVSLPAHAVKPSPKTPQAFTITIDELRKNCTIADQQFTLSGGNLAIYTELRRCCEIYDAFEICETERIATISEISDALRVAVYYFRRTNDKKFIHHIKSYIRKNHINLRENLGLPLIESAIILEDGCNGFVRFLLGRCHVNIHGVDPEGNTLLHTATALHKQDMIRILLEHGANFRAMNLNGVTPYQIAQKSTFCDPYGIKDATIFKKFFKKYHIKP